MRRRGYGTRSDSLSVHLSVGLSITMKSAAYIVYTLKIRSLRVLRGVF